MRKFLIYSLLTIAVIAVVTTLAFDRWISWKTANYIYDDVKKLPTRTVGMILGTSKYFSNGLPNEYYKYRIQGAINAYNNGKIKFLLVSGDNTHHNYNEPIIMRRDLISAGIPATKIVLDFAGFRTLDSVIRTQKVFTTNNFTIITQRFHCERALFIAIKKEIDAQCYAVSSPKKILKVRLREVFARINALIDIYILKSEPRFLGKQESILEQIKISDSVKGYPAIYSKILNDIS
ncbi:MAG: outer membrane permeability protein SanA [Arsenophonus sp. NC-TX2-MAG3]